MASSIYDSMIVLHTAADNCNFLNIFRFVIAHVDGLCLCVCWYECIVIYINGMCGNVFATATIPFL